MREQEFRCFGAAAGGGNPALVIENGPVAAAARQALARARARTCVFLDPSDQADVSGVLDFVYPHTRSPLCLHATLAAAHVVFARQRSDAPLRLITAMQGQTLQLTRSHDALFVGLTRQQAPQIAAAATLPARLLAAAALQLASAARIASVGSPKLLLEVADPETLYALTPDLAAIAAWGQQHGVNGCYVWCRRADGDYEGRSFNHLDPALEDSATGVAAAALSIALGHAITLHQGRMSGRACRMQTRLVDATVLVGGRVEAVATSTAPN